MTVQNKRPIGMLDASTLSPSLKAIYLLVFSQKLVVAYIFSWVSHLLEFLFKWYRLVGPFCCFEISAPCSSDNYKDIRCADPDLQAYIRLLGAA